MKDDWTNSTQTYYSEVLQLIMILTAFFNQDLSSGFHASTLCIINGSMHDTLYLLNSGKFLRGSAISHNNLL